MKKMLFTLYWRKEWQNVPMMLKISSNSQVQNTFESLKVCSCLLISSYGSVWSLPPMKISFITNSLCWSTSQTPPPSRLGAPETATGASPAGLYAEPQMQWLPSRPCIGWNLQSHWCSEETDCWWCHHQLSLLAPQPSCGSQVPRPSLNLTAPRWSPCSWTLF